MSLKNDITNNYSSFNSDYNSKTNNPGWVANVKKEITSKNISVAEWNTLYENIRRTASDNVAVYNYVSKLTEILNNIADTIDKVSIGDIGEVSVLANTVAKRDSTGKLSAWNPLNVDPSNIDRLLGTYNLITKNTLTKYAVPKLDDDSVLYGNDSSGNLKGYTIDTTPINNSNSLVTSGGVYTSLDEIRKIANDALNAISNTKNVHISKSFTEMINELLTYAPPSGSTNRYYNKGDLYILQNTGTPDFIIVGVDVDKNDVMSTYNPTYISSIGNITSPTIGEWIFIENTANSYNYLLVAVESGVDTSNLATKEDLENIQDLLVFDAEPIAGSTNLVNSDGINKFVLNSIKDFASVAWVLSNFAQKATTLAGYGITDAYTSTEIDNKFKDLVDNSDSAASVKTQLENYIAENDAKRLDKVTTITEVPQAYIKNADGTQGTIDIVTERSVPNDDVLVTGRVIVNEFNAFAGLFNDYATKEALATKQDILTFDPLPAENSSNPVESGGVYIELNRIFTNSQSYTDFKVQEALNSGGSVDVSNKLDKQYAPSGHVQAYVATSDSQTMVDVKTSGDLSANGGSIVTESVVVSYVDDKIGEIETVLDSIIAIQKSLIGGDA